MLEFSDLNYLAIVVAILINLSVGSFWYSPAGFGKLWSRLSGVDMMKLPKDVANKAIATVAVSAVVQMFTLAVLVNSLAANTLGQGLAIGLLVWAGFIAATTLGDNMYASRGVKYWWLNTSFFLVVMPINAIIFATWR